MTKITVLALLVWFAFVAIVIGAVIYTEPVWWKWIEPTKPETGGHDLAPGQTICYDGSTVWYGRPDGHCYDEDKPKTEPPKGPRL